MRWTHHDDLPPPPAPPVLEALEGRTLFAATPLGEAGAVTFSQPDAATWVTVDLHRDYINPVVIATAQTLNGTDPFTVRVRNVSAGSFEVQIDEWDYLDGVHATAETIGYLVIEAGTHTLDDGTLLQAGFASVDSGDVAVALPVTHGATPVVLTQVSTVNEADAVVTRPSGVGAGGFTVRLSEQEPTQGPHVSETVGWVSVDAGAGLTGERRFEAGDTGDVVTDAAVTQGLTPAFGAAPVVLAMMQSLDGGDPAATHVLNAAAGSFQTLVQEEQADNAEVAHTTETVGFLAWDIGLINLGPNTVPVTADESYGTDEDTVLTVLAAAGVLGNDADPELGPLTAVVVSGPSHGGLVLNADGGFVYTPDADYFGADSFTYDAVDLEGATTSATVSLTVNPIDDVPIAADDMVSLDEDGVVAASVGGNDVELDGDPVSFALVSGPVSGDVVFNGDGSFTYTPDADFNGGDSFTYRITDDQGGSDTATVSITVDAVNDAPVLTPLRALGIGPDEPAVLVFALADVDAGGSTLRLTITVDGGFVSLPSVVGGAWVVGDGVYDATLTLDATLAQLQQALSEVRVSDNGVLVGIDVTVSVDDLGASGSGGALRDSLTLPVGLILGDAEEDPAGSVVTTGVDEFDDAADPAVPARQRLGEAAAPLPVQSPVGYTVQHTLIALPDGALVAERAGRGEEVSAAGVDGSRLADTETARLDQASPGVLIGAEDAGEAIAEVDRFDEPAWLDESVSEEVTHPSDTDAVADVPVLPGRLHGWAQAASGVLLLAWSKASERFNRRRDVRVA